MTLSYRLFPVLLSAAILPFAHPAVVQQSVPLVPETLEQSAQPQLRGRLVLETIHSAALEQNLLGDLVESRCDIGIRSARGLLIVCHVLSPSVTARRSHERCRRTVSLTKGTHR